MGLPIFIKIILGIEVLLVSAGLTFHRINREPKVIRFLFIISAIISIVGLFGILGLSYDIETLFYTLMFGPILFFSIYQGLRYYHKKRTGIEPIISSNSSYDNIEGRNVSSGDYLFTFSLLILTALSLFGLGCLFELIR